MSRRTASWLAWSVCTVSLLLSALAVLLIFLGWSTSPPEGGTSWWEQALGAVELIGAPVLGALIASRLPKNPYGWVWLGYGAAFALSTLMDVYVMYVEATGSGIIPWPVYLLSVLGWGVGFVLVPFVLLLFPDGHLPSRRWRFLAWVYAATGTFILVLVPFRPDIERNRFGISGPIGEAIATINTAMAFVVFAAIALSILSLVIRYFHAAGLQRQQLKWLAYAAMLIGAWIIIDLLLPLSKLSGQVGGLSFMGLYVAIGIAIFRYRLYDIDIIINRTLVYGSLTAVLVAVYFGGVVGLQYVCRALTGGESQLAVVASTLAIAALFYPLRRRVQGLVDRRFYRRKYDARKTLEAFSVKLRDETDLEALNSDLVGVVRETIQPAHVSLWLRPETTSKGGQAT